MNQPVVDAISSIIREKNIDRETFQEIIEQVFLKAIEKRYGHADNFTVIFNLEKGDIEIYADKEVVEDGMVEDESLEIDLSKAIKTDPDIEVGDEFTEIIDYESFGRRLVLSTKQNLIQRIKEIEKQNLFEEFSKRIGEVVIGDVYQISRRDLRINVDKTEVVMPYSEQMHNERYRRGQSIKAIIKEVRETSREPEIIVSRRDTTFVRRLFEVEVPEIYDGIVEIKQIAREAGDRSKVAVISNDKRVDPVGACVGMKGVRIQAIVRELNNEKIDIIHWTGDRELMIRRSLAPVIPIEIIFHGDPMGSGEADFELPGFGASEPAAPSALDEAFAAVTGANEVDEKDTDGPIEVVEATPMESSEKPEAKEEAPREPERRQRVTVVIPDDQMSMAIGRRGQNIRLACAITGFDIQPIKESDYYIEELPLEEVEEFDEEMLEMLEAAGFESADEVMDIGYDGLIAIEGFDEETSRAIIEIIETYFEDDFEEDEA